ncbi:MAG: hypothetical protein KDD02_10685, partial [Phaeodactylibacter sp.]|nr:hypothetical protein [Phaeodactylibacter sp.]
MLTLTRAIFLAFIWSMPALLWSTNAFYWEEPDNCQWQLQQPAVPSLEWATLTADTIRPIFATHSCDLVCPDFQVDWIAVNAICGEHNGKITVFPVGYPAGTIFHYNWSGSSSTSNVAENLGPGVYTVSITVAQSGNGDFRNCDLVVPIPVSETGGPKVAINTLPASCLTEDGKVKLNILSGTPPFVISWNGNTQTVNSLGLVQIGGLAAGQYFFTVTDNNGNGCTTSKVVDIDRDNSDVFSISLSKTNPSACGTDDGTLTVTFNGGFPPYTVSIGAGINQTTSSNTYTFTGLPPALYTVTVQDAFLCESEGDIAISNQCPPSINGWVAVNADCPDGAGYLTFNGSGSATEYFQVRQKISTWVIATVPGNQAAVIAVPYGEYKIKRLSTTDNCICEFKVAVTAPDPLQVIVDAQGGECIPGGSTTGAIKINSITGGTPPYDILITDASGAAVSDPESLGGGAYTILVTDANNCQAVTTAVVLIGGGGLVDISIRPQDTLICEGGSVLLEAGVAPDTIPASITWYNASWDSLGAGNSFLTTPPAGINEYWAVASGPCNADTAFTRVKVAAAGALTVMPDDTLVCTADTVHLTVSGVLAECVVWLNSGGAPVDTGAQLAFVPQPGANTYIATLPGLDACVIPDTAKVFLLPSSISVSIQSENTKLCVGDTACLAATVNPADAMATVTWFDESGAEVGTGLELCVSPSTAGNFTYTAIADNGCNTDTASAPVVVIADNTKIEIMPSDTVV